MALETTFRELFSQLKNLKGTLEALRCLLPDDPQNVEVALVQHRRESVDSASGWLDNCLVKCQAAQAVLSQPGDMNRLRQALTSCQTSFDAAERTCSVELLSYEKLREVVKLGVRRKGIWLIWSQNARRDLDSCRYELDLTRKALTACWQELAELAGTTNISVQATNVGQQIVARRSELGDFEVEGVT
jgi:hypothetical protein